MGLFSFKILNQPKLPIKIFEISFPIVKDFNSIN